MRKQKILAFILMVTMIVTMLPVQFIPGVVNSGIVQAATVAELRAQFVAQAKTWIGKKESDGSYMEIINYFNANKPSDVPAMTGSLSWCAAYVSVVAMQCGFTDIMTVSRGAGSFGKIGTYHTKSSGYAPQPGDLILYCEYQVDSNGNMVIQNGQPVYLQDGSKRSHVGIVVSYDASTKKVTTIDGNMNNSVMISTFSATATKVHGYAEPNYASKASASPISGATLWTAETGFYAYLINLNSWVHTGVNISNGNVEMAANDARSAKQIWKFTRQSDNSYIIENQYDGRVLECVNGGTSSGTNVQVATSNGSTKQRWFLYYISSNGGWEIKSACSNYVLEMAGNVSSAGTNVRLGSNIQSNANIWSIYNITKDGRTYSKPAAPAAPVVTANRTTLSYGQTITLSWNEVSAVNFFDIRSYDFHIYPASGEQSSSTQLQNVEIGNKTNYTTSLPTSLPAGKYKIIIFARNTGYSDRYTASNTIIVTYSGPTATNTPRPTATNTPRPTATNTPRPTATNTPRPTATNTPRPTATNTPVPTVTNTPVPTVTNTPVPMATDTPVPTVTNTPVPTVANTPVPMATDTPVPTVTPTVTSEPTVVPTATDTPTVVPTTTSEPTPTEEVLPTPTEEVSPTPEGPTMAPPTPTDAPDDTRVADFVERLYTVALDRPSEEGGKQYWISELLRGTSGATAARGFFLGSELEGQNISNIEYVTRLYRTFMNREPDDDGMMYWLSEINAGKTREDIFCGFINSPEWIAICEDCGINPGSTIVTGPSQGIIDFATRLYTTCLGRDGEDLGIQYWSNELYNGRITGTQVAHDFFFGSEFTGGNYSNIEYIRRLYRTFMGREADDAGLEYWLNNMSAGMNREQVFTGFAQSGEFTSLCQQAGINP